MPRKRGDRSTLSLGYSTVMCGRNWFLSVTQSPTHSSRSRNVFRISFALLVRGASTGRVVAPMTLPSPLHGGLDHDHETREDHVCDRQRDEPLPSQGHELVVAVARVRPAEPDVHEQKQ